MSAKYIIEQHNGNVLQLDPEKIGIIIVFDDGKKYGIEILNCGSLEDLESLAISILNTRTNHKYPNYDLDTVRI